MGTPREIKVMPEEVPGGEPAPLSETLIGPPASLLASASEPVRVPVAVGEKRTSMVQAAPAASVAAHVLASMKSPVIEMTILASAPDPVLVSDRVWATLAVPVV